MSEPISIIQSIQSPKLFGSLPRFRKLDSWASWLVVLKAIFGLEITTDELITFQRQYGRLNEESLDQFLSQNDLSFLDLADELDLPAIDETYFRDPDQFGVAGEDEQGRLDQKSPVICPACGHSFVP